MIVLQRLIDQLVKFTFNSKGHYTVKTNFSIMCNVFKFPSTSHQGNRMERVERICMPLSHSMSVKSLTCASSNNYHGYQCRELEEDDELLSSQKWLSDFVSPQKLFQLSW